MVRLEVGRLWEKAEAGGSLVRWGGSLKILSDTCSLQYPLTCFTLMHTAPRSVPQDTDHPWQTVTRWP